MCYEDEKSSGETKQDISQTSYVEDTAVVDEVPSELNAKKTDKS